MYRLIPTVVSFALLRLCSQTLAADHNLIPRQATTCDPTQPAPTANPDGSLNTFTISVINPILPGPTFMLGVAPRTPRPNYLGSNLFLSKTGESLFNIMYGTNLYTLSVTNHFCGFDNSSSSLEDKYEVYCGVDQDLQPAKTGVVGLTWALVTTCPNPSGPPVYVVQATIPAGFPNPAPGNFQVPKDTFEEGTVLYWCNNPDECTSSNSVIVNLEANFLPPVPTPTTTTVTETMTATATVTETDTETVTVSATAAACQGLCIPLLGPF